MAISRLDLKDRVIRFLNKTSNFPGFYDDDKLNDAVQEAADYVATHMFIGGEGWLVSIDAHNTTAGQSIHALSSDVALIREVRYKIGDIFVPLTYNDRTDQASYDSTSGVRQFANQYKLVGNNIVFDPPLAEGGTGYLQIESLKYPTAFTSDGSTLGDQFQRAFQWYMKYKTASILAGSIEKDVRTWGQEEAEWFNVMINLVNRRNMKFTRIREFE